MDWVYRFKLPELLQALTGYSGAGALQRRCLTGLQSWAQHGQGTHLPARHFLVDLLAESSLERTG